MKKYLITILFIFSWGLVHSQVYTFEKRSEGNYFKLDIFKNPYDGFRYLYKKKGFYTPNYIDMIKTDTLGNILNNISVNIGFDINNIIPVETGFLVGASEGFINNSALRMVKISSSGIVQWSKEYFISGNSNFSPRIFDVINNEIVSTASLNQFPAQFLVIKTDTSGNVITTRIYELNSTSGFFGGKFYDLVKLNNGNYAAILALHTGGCCVAPAILYLDNSLNIISGHKILNSIGAEILDFKIRRKSDDGFLMVGTFNNLGGFIINLDSSLNQIWAYYTTNSTSSTFLQFIDIIKLINGNFVVGGTSYSSSPFKHDVLLLNIDPAGNTNWSKIIGTTYDEQLFSLVYEENDGIYIAGMADSGLIGFNYDGLFMKTDTNGNTSCMGAPIAVTKNNFNVLLNSETFIQSSISVTTTNVTTSLISGMTFTNICDGIVSTNEIVINPSVELFPNPAVDELYVWNLDLNEISDYTIYNVFGSMTQSGKFNKDDVKKKINISGLQNAIYLLEIKTKSGGVVKKFVVNR